MNTTLSMVSFALATSITPGPVNLLAFTGAARCGLRPALMHVTGATLGFTALLLASAAGLHVLLARLHGLAWALQAGGIAYLAWMAWGLFRDDGCLGPAGAAAPSFMGGAALQWLNPKAWLACGAGVAAFVGDAGWSQVALFAGLYMVICWCSLACWAVAGWRLHHHLARPSQVRVFNRIMAALLAASAGYLLLAR